MKMIKSFNEYISEAKRPPSPPLEVMIEVRKFNATTVIDFIERKGTTFNLTERGTILAYHGTSMSNLKKIIKSERLNLGTFFSLDEDTAKTYANMLGGKPTHTIFELYPGSLNVIAGSYLSSCEDLFRDLHDGIYKPRDLLYKNRKSGL